MKWLDIPTHRVLEVERNELMNEFDMYDEAASCAAVEEHTSCSVGKTADGLSSLSSVISMALLHESASIWRRFEALPIAIRQPHCFLG